MSKPHESKLPEDPSGIEAAHDVLAAEEFALPGRSPGEIPPDPTGIRGPHDVLAAEDFAMPSGGIVPGEGGLDPRSFIPGLALAAVLLLIVRLLRR
jgi:hypothetical protein